MTWLPPAIAVLLGARLFVQLLLEGLNAGEVRRHRGALPAVFQGLMDDATYRKSVDYTLAKSRLNRVDSVWETVVLAAVLFSGILPASWTAWQSWTGSAAAWSGTLYVLAVLLVLAVPGLPLEWWAQFHLEERFGFNRSTRKLWMVDKLKGVVVSCAIGFPLLWVLLKLVEGIGAWWWLWAWGFVFGMQIVLIVLYPLVILPWFNKLTPLPEGDLRARLLALAERARFHARTIQVMDGSRRSAHSNAFFTGFGRFRRIVLFDTLMQQLAPEELEAVLAHEIGHYKLGHVPRGLALSAGLMLAAFAVIGWLAATPAFFAAFGFSMPHAAVALLLFVLLSGLATFWFAPLANVLSRRHEYQADAFARRTVGGADAMIGSLRKLTKENLSNLTPHPLFSAFYYSHPTLAEREAALRRAEAR